LISVVPGHEEEGEPEKCSLEASIEETAVTGPDTPFEYQNPLRERGDLAMDRGSKLPGEPGAVT
jgi:hypothetical protein